MTELKPCPFCGGKARVIKATNIVGKKVYAVYCQDCYIANNQLIPDGETFYWAVNPDEPQVSDGRQAFFYDEIDKAVEHWNTRYERTCRVILPSKPIFVDNDFRCSECDAIMYPNFKYCPMCGAKVIHDA